MINKLIKELALRPCINELHNDDWLMYSKLFIKLAHPDRVRLTKVLSAHSGVPESQTIHALNNLISDTGSTEEEALILTELQKSQNLATFKIHSMQQRHCFKHINLKTLSISRAEWLIFINRFEREERSSVTSFFFFRTLSSIKKIKYEELTALGNRIQPPRHVKRTIQEGESSSKKLFRPLLKDDGQNPLILETQDEDIDVQLKIQATGARCSSLVPASPDPRYSVVMRTPGQTKVRPLCEINGETLYKHCTPISIAPKEGRLDLQKTSIQSVIKKLPKLRSERAEPIEFTATLDAINERSGMPRRIGQLAIMKASASDVFRAYGIKISSADGRFHHWYHLKAELFGDPLEIISTQGSDKEIINLVPSTAAANYNTLEAIELFIRNKLIDEDTDIVKIKVEPIYSDDSLIPDMLIYSLSWTENYGKKCNETFYINPQSYQRITKSMHESIAVLREHKRDQAVAPQVTADDLDLSSGFNL